MQRTDIIVLAAGKGSRMQSELAKVLHPLAGKPLLGHVLDAVNDLGQVHVVVGHQSEQVKDFASPYGVQFAMQRQQHGTGHAVQCAIAQVHGDKTLVALGDVPLLRQATLVKLINQCHSAVCLLTLTLADPTGYGRIVRNQDGEIEAIVEQKDCTPEQLKINEVNTGIMVFDSHRLKQWLPQLEDNNASHELYLTDVIAMAKAEGVQIESHTTTQAWEVAGVNTPEQLAKLERLYYLKGLDEQDAPQARRRIA